MHAANIQELSWNMSIRLQRARAHRDDDNRESAEKENIKIETQKKTYLLSCTNKKNITKIKLWNIVDDSLKCCYKSDYENNHTICIKTTTTTTEWQWKVQRV